MNKSEKFATGFIIRIIGAVGFLCLTYQQNVLGTALVGIGSVIIAAGEV
jgi:hypothetical protein